MIFRKALVLCVLMISAPYSGFSQQQEDEADILDAAYSIINSSELTTQQKTDSLSVFIINPGNYKHFSDKAFDAYVNTITEKINKAFSLQSKYYWAKHLGRFFDKNGKIGEANLYYQIALNAAETYDNTDGVIEIRHLLTYMYFGNDLYENAMTQVYKNLDYARSLNDSAALDKVYGMVGYVVTTIAYINRDSSLQDSALKFLAHSFEIETPGTSVYGERAMQYCYALARSNQREKLIKLCKHIINDVYRPANIDYFRLSGQLMSNYAIMGMRDSSLIYVEKFIDGADKYYVKYNFDNLISVYNDKFLTAGAIIELCYTLWQNKMYDEIIGWIGLTKEAGVNIQEFERIQLDRLLAGSYYAVGNYVEAAHLFKSLYERDRESSKSDLRNVQLKTASFAKTEIELQQKVYDKFKQQQKMIAQNEKKAKRILLISFTVGSVGLLFFLLLLYRRFRKSQEQKAIIEEQKLKVDEAYDQLEEKNTEIMDSINYAKRIQSAILPPSKLVKAYLQDSFILYKPKDIVAGDFYWMEVLSGSPPSKESEEVGNTILFAAADCTGHGVPGAMVSVVCNNGLNRSIREYGLKDPGQILDKTRELVIAEFEKSEEEVKDGMDIALCSLTFAQKENQKQSESGSSAPTDSSAQTRTVSDYSALLKYAGAHNPLWIIRKTVSTETESSHELIEVKADKQPIGKYDNPVPYNTHTVSLNKGDSFYIFSDGYADQFGGDKGKKLKAKNFKSLLLSIQGESMEKQRELIDEAFESWKGKFEQLDDVCVIGVRV